MNQEKVARHLYTKKAYKGAFLVLFIILLVRFYFTNIIFKIYGGNNYGSYCKDNHCTQDGYSRC